MTTENVKPIEGNDEPPYSQADYDLAKEQGLDLDDWHDYQNFYGLGEQEGDL